MSKIKASAERIIHAPIETVWQIMTEVEKYGEWNPFIPAVKTDSQVPDVGRSMTLVVQFKDRPSTMEAPEKVTVYQPPHPSPANDGRLAAEWAYRYDNWMAHLYIVHATRFQRLTETAEGKTHYATEEVFQGIAASFIPLDGVQAGFNTQADALKAAAERAH